MKRLFLAIPIAEVLSAQLLEAVQPYHENRLLADAKWVPAENFHLTTLFLGEVPDAHLPEMQTLIRGVCAHIAPFTLLPERITLFPHHLPSKQLWLRFQRSLAFEELHAELKQFLTPLAKALESEQDLIPHVSLARLKNAIPPKKLSFQTPKLEPVQVTETLLFESILSPTGPITYHLLDRFPHDL